MHNEQIFPMLVSISEIPTLFQSLTRKADQLATHMNSGGDEEAFWLSH